MEGWGGGGGERISIGDPPPARDRLSEECFITKLRELGFIAGRITEDDKAATRALRQWVLASTDIKGS